MRRWLIAVALIMAVVVGGTVFLPRRAAASNDLVYIIPAAVGGAVAVVVLIAIFMADRKSEPELELAEAQRRALPPAREGLHFATECRPTDGGLPLLCW